MAKKKKMRTVGYTIPINVGKETVRVTRKTLKSAKAAANAFCKNYLKNVRKVKNVAEGFRDARGVFHSIRHSEDYKPYRAGEFPKSGKTRRQRKAAAKKAAGRRAGKKAGSGRQSVS